MNAWLHRKNAGTLKNRTSVVFAQVALTLAKKTKLALVEKIQLFVCNLREAC